MKRACLVAVLCAGAAIHALRAVPPASEAPTLRGWTRLTLTAEESPLYSGSIDIEVSEKTHEPSRRAAVVVETRSRAKLLGAIGFEENSTSWIDPVTRRPIELFQIRPGDGARRFRFMPEGVQLTTWEAPGGKRNVPFDQWPAEESPPRPATFDDGSPVPASATLVDPYSMLYLLRDSDASAGGTREFIVMQKRHAVKITVTTSDKRAQERTVTDDSTGRSVTLRLTERRLELKASGQGGPPRGMLGMEGDLAIWMDETSGAIVEVNGKAPAVGPTSVRLTSFRRAQ